MRLRFAIRIKLKPNARGLRTAGANDLSRYAREVKRLMERPIIQFFNVSKPFGANPVLRGVSHRIYQGQVTTIMGKSGIKGQFVLRVCVELKEAQCHLI